MLDLPRYLFGVLDIALLAAFATLGGAALRNRLLPSLAGAPAHLATAVIALALLIGTAELLGSFGFFEPIAYLVCVGVVGMGLAFAVGGGRGCPSRLLPFSPGAWAAVRDCRRCEKETAAARDGHPRPPTRGAGYGAGWTGVDLVTALALLVAIAATVKFGLEAKPKLTTGMTGFDSTWYHGPFAAGFFQSGNTWDLHYIAPQFLSWFYPANAEIFHATGMLAFGRDVLSPLLNVGWFVGCLVACWCIGRPYRVAPWSLGLGAVALSLPVLVDQAGEARNDIAGIFFLLAAVAIALNAWAGEGGESDGNGGEVSSIGPYLVSGLAAGLAAGTKLNFLLPAAVLVLGLPLLAPTGRRWGALAATVLAALAGGGYWYLRNLAHSGNPLPWFDSLGPVSLPAPDQALGGREGHSVLGYLLDGAVWSDWFLPGLRDGLSLLWPLALALALAGLTLALAQPLKTPPTGRNVHSGWTFRPVDRDAGLLLAGLVGVAAIVAWLVAPTSASGPDGMPRGFESGLRYLAPALVLGFALLPATWPLRAFVTRRWPGTAAGRGGGDAEAAVRSSSRGSGEVRPVPSVRRRFVASLHLDGHSPRKRSFVALVIVAALVVAIGYPVQRHYLRERYASPTFAAPGLNAAFAWATPLSNARIATTSTRQYPLFGTDLSNGVQFIGERKPHGGFVAPTTCKRWRELLNEGDYDYAITTRDRIEPGKPPYPATASWTAGKGATPILRKPPTVIYKLTAPLDPSGCP